jgi:ribosomal protein S18 acetylase RimI-like enzyme
MAATTEQQRIHEFELDLERDACERVETHEWGTSILCPSIPLVWSANWVLIEQAGMSAREIEAVADEVIGGAGMAHRSVLVDDFEEAFALAPEFASLGWKLERGVWMAWRREPEREPETEVEEVGQNQLETLRRELIRDGLPIKGEQTAETVSQLLGWDRMLGAVGGDRWFMARADGKPVSCCRLLVHDGIGQVEDVGTLPAARDRGLGRAVTLAAARASVADGNELTYLGALADDWPRLMYNRLGFDEIGENVAFKRLPG